MNSEDQSHTWLLCTLIVCLLLGYMFDGSIEYLEREHGIQQQRLEIQQRQMVESTSELRAQIRLHCLERTDISGEAKAKECWGDL